MTQPTPESPFMQQALAEMRRADLFNEDGAYGGHLGRAVEALCRVYDQQGHSGASSAFVTKIFCTLLRDRPLSQLTLSPDEWQPYTREGRDLSNNKRCTRVWRDNATPDVGLYRDGFRFQRPPSSASFVTYPFTNRPFRLPGLPPEPVCLTVVGDALVEKGQAILAWASRDVFLKDDERDLIVSYTTKHLDRIQEEKGTA